MSGRATAMTGNEVERIVEQAKEEGKDHPTRAVMVVLGTLAICGLLLTIGTLWYAYQTGHASFCPEGYNRHSVEVVEKTKNEIVTIYTCVNIN
jgi:hypothetical protein